MQLQRGRLRRGQPTGAQGQVQADAEHDDDVVIGISISTGTGRRRNHQFREQPAQLEPVAEHVVRPFEFQRAVRLVRAAPYSSIMPFRASSVTSPAIICSQPLTDSSVAIARGMRTA